MGDRPPPLVKHDATFPHWEEIVLGLLIFAIVCYLLLRFVFPAMRRMFAERVQVIEGGLERAEAVEAEATELLREYRTRLVEARTDAARIRDEARADAESIRHDALAAARDESDRIIAAGQEQLAAQRERVVGEMRSEVGHVAVDLAGRIVGEALTDEALDPR